tara:strand:+ start:6585 stop:7070 length:486 start_codon:yes stop_codon:yes gene_type:complete
MSTMRVDNITEKTSGAGVKIPGHIIQIQRASIGGNITTTSSSPVATGLTCAITPKVSTSLIMVQCLGGRSYVQAGQQLDISLYKDGSNVDSVGAGRWESQYSVTDHHHGGYSACHFETAGSTSSRTYQVYFDIGSGTGYFTNSPGGNNEYLVHLVVTEIAQ